MSTQKTFEELKTEAMPPAGEFIEFAGNDNCEDCEGWDGTSARCDCGNRRVYWSLSDDKASVYAMAD